MIRRAARGLARAALVAGLALSVTATGWAGWKIARDPLIRPLVDRSVAGFVAALERETARTATPEAVAVRLSALLDEDPRNWIAIAAVEDVAAERGILLPQALTARRTAAWDADSGVFAVAGGCLVCAWDAAECSLSEALICNAPVTLSPVGDVLGIGRAGLAAATGAEVDQLDLTLSAVGLGATVAAVATGGSSLTLKAGASLLKLARRMSLVPPRLLALILDTARTGIRWDEAMRLDTLTDPARLIDPVAVRPLAETASDLGRVAGRLDAATTLHLLRYVDGPEDARRLAVATEAMGPKVVGRLEILGKSRFMRAGLRWSDQAVALVLGFFGLAASLASALAGLVQGRLMRRGLRHLSHR
ncbi:MAG: hypothetical protein IAE87_15155 [Rhodobacteraceae bacterium]|jgi:hypothetical protein|nr:hypothetical protein [Paracoccaceae bacterium]